MSDMISQLQNRAVEGEISCVDAHEIASELGATPLKVGKTVNRQTELRFYRCQLGLFGYGPKEEGKSKIVQKAERVPEEIEAAIRAHTKDGRISCLHAWEVADRFQYPRLGLANILETMGIKVKPCQLGCF